MSRPLLAVIASAAAGFAVWTFIALFAAGEIREAWDVPAYWSVGIPLLAIVAGTAGYLAPTRVWRWPLWTALGHAVGMAVAHPAGTDLGLIPLSIVFVGVPLVIALSIPAAVGAALARRGWDSRILV